MPLTEEQHSQLLLDLLRVFQERYGDQWILKLHSNLKPSPLQQIAEQRGVPLSQVKRVRSQLLKAGQIYAALNAALTEPLSTNLLASVEDESS